MANVVREVELNQENLSKLIDRYKKVSLALSSAEFKKFLLEKCIQARDKILEDKKVNEINFNSEGSAINDEANSIRAIKYESSHHEVINGDVISLYNDAVLAASEMNSFFNDEYKNMEYSDGLSVAELVEYGAGAEIKNVTGDEWKNKSGRDTWYYKSDNDEPVLSSGSEGKYIYYDLGQEIEDKANDWVEEFLQKKMGGLL